MQQNLYRLAAANPGAVVCNNPIPLVDSRGNYIGPCFVGKSPRSRI
ncbi:MAG: hypothetical protein AVDCRST_MAG05-1173 [uncultured Rubrobacteraceae bacterium]|uniref:Uncharacterized protein n=1 Tax=uncultured Rubrobacteraceae bacterium TaxID=349277 RepID=A0A6J4RZ18_9ACTN|nr:MAG: hypothetical protein AVDCRST_MAG05-1173 [uncultured Rubrobacteraceae bacterium]